MASCEALSHLQTLPPPFMAALEAFGCHLFYDVMCLHGGAMVEL